MKTIEMMKPEKVKELFDYDWETGNLIWKERPVEDFKTVRGAKIFNTQCAGKVAGCLNKPHQYWYITVDGVTYKAHRLVWAWHHGEWPEGQIDHIEVSENRRSDNRIENLRVVEASENQKNKLIYLTNKTGVSGVYKRGNRWRVTIGSASTAGSFLGFYEDFFEAVCVRKSAELERGFHENHGKVAA